MKDFFISYNGTDRAWAEWIGWVLEEAGYSVVLQEWDFRPGGNFVLEMQGAALGTRKTVVVLSEAYLQAEFTRPEWAAALVEDPRGERRKLIPLRIALCSPDGLLKAVIYADLVGLTADKAKDAVLTAVSDMERTKPARAPDFPGSGAAATTPTSVTYPGKELSGSGALSFWQQKLDFLQEQEAIAADSAQKFALRKQIDEARSMISELESSTGKASPEPQGLEEDLGEFRGMSWWTRHQSHIFGVLIVLGLMWATYAWWSPKRVAPRSGNLSEALVASKADFFSSITLEQYWRQYYDSTATALQRDQLQNELKGKTIIWFGTIRSVEPGHDGAIDIVVSSEPGNSPAFLSFDSSQRVELLKLRKEQTIKFTCRIRSFLASPFLENCKVLSVT